MALVNKLPPGHTMWLCGNGHETISDYEMRFCDTGRCGAAMNDTRDVCSVGHVGAGGRNDTCAFGRCRRPVRVFRYEDRVDAALAAMKAELLEAE